MNQYLIDTDYAVRKLIEIITAEEIEITRIQLLSEEKKPKLEFLYKRFRDSEWNDDVEIKQQSNFVDWAMEQKEFTDLQEEIMLLESSNNTKKDSIGALCGALLQIAKQGISKVYGNLVKCPDGRIIGTEKLKNVIWQGRNQSLHYEEGSFKEPVQNCFANLTISSGDQFSLTLYPQENLAHSIIKIIGWKEYLKYIADMQSLLPS